MESAKEVSSVFYIYVVGNCFDDVNEKKSLILVRSNLVTSFLLFFCFFFLTSSSFFMGSLKALIMHVY